MKVALPRTHVLAVIWLTVIFSVFLVFYMCFKKSVFMTLVKEMIRQALFRGTMCHGNIRTTAMGFCKGEKDHAQLWIQQGKVGIYNHVTVNPKGNQPWILIGRTDARAPILCPADVKSWLIGKHPDAGEDWGQEEKGTTEDEMVGWHHRLNRQEFEQSPRR